MTDAPCRDEPSVSAVVINYNGGDRTIRCLEALSGQTRLPDHIVVVDNGSHDGGPERIRDRFTEVEMIELGENRGLPAARNIGLAAARSDLVLLTDNDIYLEPDCLSRLLVAQAATTPTVVCPRIRLIPERDVVQADGPPLTSWAQWCSSTATARWKTNRPSARVSRDALAPVI